MIIHEGDLFRLRTDYLNLDCNTVCECLEDTDMDFEPFVMAKTPEGIMIIPVNKIGYFSKQY